MHLNKYTEVGKCGYCHSTKLNKGNSSWGIGTPRISVLDYETLKDRGWMRCGHYLYKVDL